MQDAMEAWMQNVHDFGHAHLLKFWNELGADDRSHLANQIQSIDFQELANLFAGVEKAVDWAELSRKAISPAAVRLNHPSPKYSKDEALECGEQAIRDGKIGMILVAEIGRAHD